MDDNIMKIEFSRRNFNHPPLLVNFDRPGELLRSKELFNQEYDSISYKTLTDVGSVNIYLHLYPPDDILTIDISFRYNKFGKEYFDYSLFHFGVDNHDIFRINIGSSIYGKTYRKLNKDHYDLVMRAYNDINDTKSIISLVELSTNIYNNITDSNLCKFTLSKPNSKDIKSDIMEYNLIKSK